MNTIQPVESTSPAPVTADASTRARERDMEPPLPSEPTRALLFCNGEAADPSIARRLAGRSGLVVCADGGVNHAIELGIRIDLVVGDLDSATDDALRRARNAGAHVERLTGQEDTDFEKALLELRRRNIQSVAVLGATGGLLDHTLGNLSILARHGETLRVVLFDRHYRMDAQWRTARYAARAGSRVSIVPLLPTSGVTLHGLRYPLHDAMLQTGVCEATCNTATAEGFTVEQRGGALLVFREIDAIPERDLLEL